MNELPSNENAPPSDGGEDHDRRVFLHGMGKWSGAAIVAAVGGVWFGSTSRVQGAWVNRRGGGGGWVNGGGGGGGWVNGRAGGGGWLNNR